MRYQIVTIIFVLFILYLFSIDMKKYRESVSWAIWVPLAWMILAGSRHVSQWLNLHAPIESPDMYIEGSPIDRAVFLFLIVLGVIILAKRYINWSILIRKNIWIVMYFLFGMISIIWSDYPSISLKRLIKAIGNSVMALIVMSERSPKEAVGVVIRRLSFLLLPLSVLFIKYYPELGRQYHMGLPMFTGVATQKNGLGQLCLITGIYFGWNLIVTDQKRVAEGSRLHFFSYITIIPIIMWLFYFVDSATSLVCMIAAIFIFLISRSKAIHREPSRILLYGIVIVLILSILEIIFDVSTFIIVNILQRDTSLTTRVPKWYGLLELARNPLLGVGYDSFWLGDRLSVIWKTFGKIHQSHNGYLEIYLNLGFIGLCLMIASILYGTLKKVKQLSIDYPFTILRLTFIVIVSIYNWTEATFYGASNMWLLLFIGILDMSGQTDKEGRYKVTVYTQSLENRIEH